MDFIKMQGVGNDYIFIDGGNNLIGNAGALAIILSDRHYGIGSDGLVIYEPSAIAASSMRIFNTDGSEAEVCGNALRCLAKLLWEEGWVDDSYFKIETKSGVKPVWLDIEKGKVKNITVDMGFPSFLRDDIALNIKENSAINYELVVEDRRFLINAVKIGNPHCVIFEKEVLSNDDFIKYARLIEKNPIFKERVNVEFVKVCDRNTLEMRVWERGVGETLGCGSGACAAVVASNINGYTDSEVYVIMCGGELKIKYDKSVIMSGEASAVYRGKLLIDNGMGESF